jgi:hypothetical protein
MIVSNERQAEQQEHLVEKIVNHKFEGNDDQERLERNSLWFKVKWLDWDEPEDLIREHVFASAVEARRTDTLPSSTEERLRGQANGYSKSMWTSLIHHWIAPRG